MDSSELKHKRGEAIDFMSNQATCNEKEGKLYFSLTYVSQRISANYFVRWSIDYRLNTDRKARSMSKRYQSDTLSESALVWLRSVYIDSACAAFVHTYLSNINNQHPSIIIVIRYRYSSY